MHNLLTESSTGLWFFGKNKQLRKFWIDLSFFTAIIKIFTYLLFFCLICCFESMYVNQYIFYQCALTDDGVLLYVSLELSCMPNALFSPLGARPPVPIVFRWSPTFTGCFNPNPWHPPVGGSAVVVPYSTDPDFQQERLFVSYASSQFVPISVPFKISVYFLKDLI